MWSEEEYSHETTRPWTIDDSEWCVCTAPLGRPVVPDVYKMSASEEGQGGVGGGGCAFDVGSTDSAESESTQGFPKLARNLPAPPSSEDE